MSNVQPTLAYPTPADLITVPTYALVPGERVWTLSGAREVLSVELGVAGGWRQVAFHDGVASVVHSQPWRVATGCSDPARIKGGEFHCDRDPGHSGRHQQHDAGELIAEWSEVPA